MISCLLNFEKRCRIYYNYPILHHPNKDISAIESLKKSCIVKILYARASAIASFNALFHQSMNFEPATGLKLSFGLSSIKSWIAKLPTGQYGQFGCSKVFNQTILS